MPPPSPSQLGALRDGLHLWRRHPGLTAALALLTMVLAQLGPALEIAAGVGPNPVLVPLFALAGMLPLEMYFLPRFQVQLDAETLDAAGNPRDAWRPTFDGRWAKAFLVRLGLGVVVGLGLALFLIPGLVLLTLFGWAPLRLLLRGDSLVEALKWSQAAMARHWPRVVQTVLAVLLIALLYQMAAGLALERLLPPMDPDLGPGALLRLKHPAFWITNLLSGALNLWVACTLLALYHRLEAAVRN